MNLEEEQMDDQHQSVQNFEKKFTHNTFPLNE